MDLPSFRTLEELTAWSKPHDETERSYVFEEGKVRVAILVVTWGSGDWWNAVLVYAYDGLQNQWRPRAVWNTESRHVRVSCDKREGTIHVKSGKGVPIFSAQISALYSLPTRDW